MLDEIEQLMKTIGEKDEAVQQLHSQIDALKESNEKEKSALKDKYEKEKIALIEEWETKMKNAEEKASLEKAKFEKMLSNKNILTRFLSYRLRNNEKRGRISSDELEAQKTELKDALRHEVNLQEEYCNLTDLIQNDHIDNFPSYVTMMTKSLVEQSGELDKLSSFLDHESHIQIYMEDLLEEMKKLNETFNADIEEWDLLDSLKELVKVQSDSLSALKPTISYIVNKNSGFEYEVNEDGLLKSISPCQCLPNTNGTGFSVTGIQFGCPAGQVVPDTEEESGISLCLDGRCPETFSEDLCVDKRTLWSEWTPCSSPLQGGDCLVETTRSRNGGSEVETKGVRPAIIEESSTLNVTIPEGYSLSVFAIGGGAGGYSHNNYGGGSRGGFKHILVNNQSFLELTITIGDGGKARGNGESTTIEGLPDYFAAPGGAAGGSHKQSVELLPNLCGSSIAWGADGSYGYWQSLGKGGVIVDGRKPTRRSTMDGVGFGAGGGHDSYREKAGYKGVAVLSLCKS